MTHKYEGGCEHVHTYSDRDPVDSHTCHCSVCKRVTGQETSHVVFFRYGDLKADHMERLNRQPFNDQNPDGALELCTCKECGKPIMLDDRQHRIRVIVPNLMGHDAGRMPATYHAYYDAATGVPRPSDGRPVHEAFRPEFRMPEPA